MKIVIAAPLYPPEVGGPAAYAKKLNEGLPGTGVEVTLVKFSDVHQYPIIVRHLAYFLRIFSALRGADAVIGFDTWSTGVPALLAARLCNKKMVVRIGGDFLWEMYINRVHERIRFSDFYMQERYFSLKERFVFAGTRWFVRRVNILVFNTAWQKDIWQKVYGFNQANAVVIENEYPAERAIVPAKRRVFVAAGRANFLKNAEALEAAFLDAKKIFPDIELDMRMLPPVEHIARIKDAYAVIIPSVSEMSSNTAIDAIKYGKPFVMTADTGVRERLAGVGIFIDTLDQEALQNAMTKLLDAEEYARACARVQAFTFSHSWEDVVQEFKMILTTLCVS